MTASLSRKRIRRGFTLIELLVVVAIIALLISILLPSLSAAREQAKRVRCGVNLYQLGQAVQSCETENNGYGPTWDDGESDLHSPGTPYNMLTWVDVLFDKEYYSDPEAAICPTDRRPDEVMARRGETQQYYFVRKLGNYEQQRPGVRTSYALNAHMHFNFREDRHADSARQVYAIDGWWNWFGSLDAAWLMMGRFTSGVPDPTGWPFNQGKVGWRHGNEMGAQTLYRDGHVGLIVPKVPASQSEILYGTVDTSRSFTWLPGESAARPYYGNYEAGGNPGRIENYDGRKPAWVNPRNTGQGGKRIGEGDNIHPFGFPEELSAVWRTNNQAWNRLPNNPEDRR